MNASGAVSGPQFGGKAVVRLDVIFSVFRSEPGNEGFRFHVISPSFQRCWMVRRYSSHRLVRKYAHPTVPAVRNLAAALDPSLVISIRSRFSDSTRSLAVTDNGVNFRRS